MTPPILKVEIARPPMWEFINAIFHLDKMPDIKPVFAWGNRIYNPHNVTIPGQLMAHEGVHCQRQVGGEVDPFLWCNEHEQKVIKWWITYCADPQFRLDEEVEAHRAEMHSWRVLNPRATRNQMRLYRKGVAERLSSPLYGSLVTFDGAMKHLKRGIKD